MLTNLKPARFAQQDSPEVKILCDFDAILSKRVGFKFQGKVYALNPVNVENYMQLTLAYRDILAMGESRSQGLVLSEDEIYSKYYNLIKPLSPEFSYDSLKQLSFALLNQLIGLILKQLAGDPGIYGENAEKKNPLT